MSDNQFDYLPQRSAGSVATVGTTTLVAVGMPFAAGAAAMPTAAGAAAMPTALASTSPKLGHRVFGTAAKTDPSATVKTDLGAAVSDIDARDWGRRPRRLSSAR